MVEPDRHVSLFPTLIDSRRAGGKAGRVWSGSFYMAKAVDRTDCHGQTLRLEIGEIPLDGGTVRGRNPIDNGQMASCRSCRLVLHRFVSHKASHLAGGRPMGENSSETGSHASLREARENVSG